MGGVNPLMGKIVSSMERSGLTPGFVVLEVLTGGEDKTDHNSRTLRSQASCESGVGCSTWSIPDLTPFVDKVLSDLEGRGDGLQVHSQDVVCCRSDVGCGEDRSEGPL
jgi:hypothetical protein